MPKYNPPTSPKGQEVVDLFRVPPPPFAGRMGPNGAEARRIWGFAEKNEWGRMGPNGADFCWEKCFGVASAEFFLKIRNIVLFSESKKFTKYMHEKALILVPFFLVSKYFFLFEAEFFFRFR